MIKIRIHPLTYFLLLSILLCGYFNYFLIISFILFMHDLGHIIAMNIFKIKIYEILILPFGSIIKSKIYYNLNSNKILFISIAGIIMQILLYLLFYFLRCFNYINELSYNIFLFYNKLIILFNIMPIIPLDGSKILLCLIERILPYKISLKIINYISLSLIIMFCMFNQISLNIIIISIYLFIKTYEEILNCSLIYHKFLLERYLNKIVFKKIKYINNINKVYKNRFNFINGEKESSFLVKMFDNQSYF